jgi:hypothetical protein
MKDMRLISRATQGVRLINAGCKGDHLISVARVEEEEDASRRRRS